MKFYFCETCGKRVTEQDVEAGRARNKKLNGVFCTSCAAGVLTMEMMPVSEDEARKILQKGQGASTPPAGTAVAPGSSSKHKSRDSNAQLTPLRRGEPPRAAGPKSNSKSVAVGIGAGLAIAALFVAVMIVNKPRPGANAAHANGAGNGGAANEPKAEPANRPAPVRPPGPGSKNEPGVPELPAPVAEPAKTEPRDPDPPADGVPEDDPDPEPAEAAQEEEPKGAVLARVPHTEFQGRAPGISERAVMFGNRTKFAVLDAAFTLAEKPAAGASLWLRCSPRKIVTVYEMTLRLNGQPLPAPVPAHAEALSYKWHEYKLPDGLLRQGRNELQLSNPYTTGANHAAIYIDQALILGPAPAPAETARAEAPPNPPAVPAAPEEPAAKPEPAAPAEPAAPSYFTAEQRAALAFYVGTFAKLRNQQVDEALAAAKAAKFEEARALAALIERAAELNRKGLEAVNRKPPAAPITFKFKGEELTGQLKRVEGAFAWVVSKGLEVRVGLEELPADLFITALNLDAKTPEGRYDLAAFHAAAGHLDQALALAKGLDEAKYCDLLSMLTHYRLLERLNAFDQGIARIEKEIAAARSAEAVQAVAQLRRTFPEIAAEQKDLLGRLEARAEGAKLSNRIRTLFPNGETLALREDLYIELKYTLKGASRRDEWIGPLWTLDTDGLRYTIRGGNTDLKFRARFQARPFRAEVVQTPDHDITYFGLGKLWLKARWIGTGQLHMTYEDRYSAALHLGIPWKQPPATGTYRYAIERTETELAFAMDGTEHFREKLPAQALQDKSFEFTLVPQRSNTIREIVLKGYLDRDWVTEALKAQPAGDEQVHRPGLWAVYYDQGRNNPWGPRMGRVETKIDQDWGPNAPDARVSADFAVYMHGFLRVDVEGEYELELAADDYVGVTIDNRLAGESTAGRTQPKVVKVSLTKGLHPLMVKFNDDRGPAYLQVRWKPPNGTFGPIPPEHLWHEAAQEKQP